MAQPNHTPRLAQTEEALTILFCLVDDAYMLLNPRARCYESIKRLADSEVITLALFQQLRGVESERSFLRDAQRFFSHLFPGVAGLHPSSLHRRVRKLRRYLEPLRREILAGLVGEPETLLIDSTLLEVLHPRQVSQSSQSAGFDGAAWVRWGDRKSTRLNSSHANISYAVFCLKKKTCDDVRNHTTNLPRYLGADKSPLVPAYYG